jgi:hypothetical protein
MSTWINCKNELPQRDKPVLIYDGDGIAVARLSATNGGWWIYESYGYNEDGEIPKVYFWMPLPEKPELQSQSKQEELF